MNTIRPNTGFEVENSNTIHSIITSLTVTGVKKFDLMI
jgi:hypothetical protein